MEYNGDGGFDGGRGYGRIGRGHGRSGGYRRRGRGYGGGIFQQDFGGYNNYGNNYGGGPAPAQGRGMLHLMLLNIYFFNC